MRIEYFGKQEETLNNWLITLEDKSAQENDLYQVINLQEKKSAQLSDLEDYNRGCLSSFLLTLITA
jgi:hypothetical protein